MMKMFEALCKKVDRLESKCGSNLSTSEDNNDKLVINPRTRKSWRCYYRTCSCCDHWGRNCPTRKPGHQVNATFKNRMGGNTKGVIGA